MNLSKRLFQEYEGMSESEKAKLWGELNDALDPIREAENLFNLIDGMDDKPINEIWNVIEKAKPSPSISTDG